MAWYKVDGGSSDAYVSRETLLTNNDIKTNIRHFNDDMIVKFNVSHDVIHTTRFNVSRETFETLTRSAK